MEKQLKITKLNSVLLCLQAHPDNEPNSEFVDRISDIEEIIHSVKQEPNVMTWRSTEFSKPLAYRTGHWDGKQSDDCLLQDKDGNIFVGTLYEGTIDGNYFADFYDKKDNELTDIVKYMEIAPF